MEERGGMEGSSPEGFAWSSCMSEPASMSPRLLSSGDDHLSAALITALIDSTDSNAPVMYYDHLCDTNRGARAWRHEEQTGLNCPAHALNNLYQTHLLNGTGGADLFELQSVCERAPHTLPTLRIYSLRTHTVYREPFSDVADANRDMLLALLSAKPGFLIMRGPHYVAVRRHMFTHTLPPVQRWCVLDSCCAGVEVYSAAGLLSRVLSELSTAYAVPRVDGHPLAHTLLDVSLCRINACVL